MMLKISVVMPSYLGDYPNAATNRVAKFHRAVKSFINQDYPKEFCELMVVADGCDKTIQAVGGYWEHENIKWAKIHKAELFSGKPRSIGLKGCTGDVICYLDSDDYFDPLHLKNISSAFEFNMVCNKEEDWAKFITFNDTIIDKLNPTTGEVMVSAVRKVSLENGVMGTSNVAHRNLPEITWDGFDGYGHDFKFIKNLSIRFPNWKHFDFASYHVCHVPNQADN